MTTRVRKKCGKCGDLFDCDIDDPHGDCSACVRRAAVQKKQEQNPTPVQANNQQARASVNALRKLAAVAAVLCAMAIIAAAGSTVQQEFTIGVSLAALAVQMAMAGVVLMAAANLLSLACDIHAKLTAESTPSVAAR